MIQVSKANVRSFNLDHLDIFWEIEPVPAPSNENAPHEIFDYYFYILRAEAALGPYDQIGGPLRDIYRFRDVQVHLLHKWRQYHYKIRVVHIPTGETKDFGPFSSSEPEPDLIAAEIIRQEDILFREFVGRRCWLFQIRTFGPTCSCFDVVMKRKTRSNHLPCFGTGWLGGYHAPAEVFIQIDAQPKISQLSSLQEQQTSDTTARMIAFPPAAPRDILIESENKRWRIVRVANTQRLRSVVHQELQLHEIPRGDIEYEIPVNVNTQLLIPSSERNFTNSYNIEKDGENYSDIYSVFGHPRGSVG